MFHYENAGQNPKNKDPKYKKLSWYSLDNNGFDECDAMKQYNDLNISWREKAAYRKIVG